jgi:hypothetical protein
MDTKFVVDGKEVVFNDDITAKEMQAISRMEEEHPGFKLYGNDELMIEYMGYILSSHKDTKWSDIPWKTVKGITNHFFRVVLSV